MYRIKIIRHQTLYGFGVIVLQGDRDIFLLHDKTKNVEKKIIVASCFFENDSMTPYSYERDLLMRDYSGFWIVKLNFPEMTCVSADITR